MLRRRNIHHPEVGDEHEGKSTDSHLLKNLESLHFHTPSMIR